MINGYRLPFKENLEYDGAITASLAKPMLFALGFATNKPDAMLPKAE